MYIGLFPILFFFATKQRCNIDAIFVYLGEGGSFFSYEVFNTKALTDFKIISYFSHKRSHWSGPFSLAIDVQAANTMLTYKKSHT